MKKLIFTSAWAFWLGAGLSLLFDIHINDWKFWLYIVVTILLVNLAIETFKNEDK